MHRVPRRALVLLAIHLLVFVSFASAQGTIAGRVVGDGGSGIPGILVAVEPSGQVRSTDHDGAFTVANLAPGTYSVVLSVGDLESRVSGVDVRDGETTDVRRVLPADFTFVASTTVTAASRTPERIVDAPAAVTRIGAETIELEGASGQIPALLQFTTGAEFAQSGIYDINFNTRGFNNLLSRRVQTLVDGRDTSAPESSIQEWYSMGFLAADLDSIELLRGPSASLYGANTVNGVMTLKTRAPRDSLGGRARLTVGELDTLIADVRWAVPLGGDWYLKALGNSTRSTSFTRPRTSSVEYPGLPLDAVAPTSDAINARSGVVRVDRYLDGGNLLVSEGGFSQSSGETFVAQAGRASIDDARRGWARGEFASPYWNVSAEFNGRKADQTALQAGAPLYTSSTRARVMGQGNRHLLDGRLRAVFGASYRRERVDSANPAGVQTLYLSPVTAHHEALFGQLDYVVSPRVKVVGGLRWDEATIHDAQVSPRLAGVVSLARDHSVRIGYNHGFQVGTYTELYLRVPAAPPLDLSALESALAPVLGGTSLGFEAVPIFAIGNPNLEVERVRSLEAGYTGAFGARGRIGVDVYRNVMRDFISDLLFGINPDYPAYQAPAALAPAARALVEQTVNGLLPGLTNRDDGGPQIVISNANTGLVHSRGIELSAGYRPLTALWLDGSYAWFDFTLTDRRPGAEPQPNAPAHRAALGATYTHARAAASLRFRWVDDFPWASGVYAGPVPSYGVADVNALARINRNWQIGVNVSNVLDNRHYEMFGGDILGRRTLVHPTFSW